MKGEPPAHDPLRGRPLPAHASIIGDMPAHILEWQGIVTSSAIFLPRLLPSLQSPFPAPRLAHPLRLSS